MFAKSGNIPLGSREGSEELKRLKRQVFHSTSLSVFSLYVFFFFSSFNYCYFLMENCLQ